MRKKYQRQRTPAQSRDAAYGGACKLEHRERLRIQPTLALKTKVTISQHFIQHETTHCPHKITQEWLKQMQRLPVSAYLQNSIEGPPFLRTDRTASSYLLLERLRQGMALSRHWHDTVAIEHFIKYILLVLMTRKMQVPLVAPAPVTH